MISRITGVLERVEGLSAEVALSGGAVVHQVLIPAYLAPTLVGRIGREATFHTLEYLESHNQGASFVPRLIGFERPSDREFFELLTTVKGIGNRKALRALAEEPRTIARAIASRDTRALQGLPEIGKRLAETMVAELVGKVERFTAGEGWAAEVKGTSPLGRPAAEAVAALVALGEHLPGAEARVRAVMERKTGGGSVEEILAAALGG